MTTRVFEFPRPAELPTPVPRPLTHGRTRLGLRGALLTALLIVPLGGAAEAPTGWLVAAASAAVVLHTAAVFGARLRWGWIMLVLAVGGLVVPRGQWPLIGPALFVASIVSLAVWFASRDNRRR